MRAAVKSRRRPDSPGQARTRRTRHAVVEAARTLFLDRGYAATTIEAISDLSSTSPATVYRLFTSKLGILHALLDVSLVGDDEAVPFADRPHVQELLANRDPHDQLAALAALVRDVMSRVAAPYRILVGAAASDSEAAALLAEYWRQRQHGQGRVARSLARAHALRPPLRERDAADIIHALTSPEVYTLFTADRGWTPDRYERWLAQTLSDQLLSVT